MPVAVWQLEHMLLRQRHDLGSWEGVLQHVDEGGKKKMLIVMFDYHNSLWKPGNPKSCLFILSIHPVKRPWRTLKSWLGKLFHVNALWLLFSCSTLCLRIWHNEKEADCLRNPSNLKTKAGGLQCWPSSNPAATWLHTLINCQLMTMYTWNTVLEVYVGEFRIIHLHQDLKFPGEWNTTQSR